MKWKSRAVICFAAAMAAASCVPALGAAQGRWTLNREEGIRYYMGEDGTIYTNTFAADGKYVGPDGTNLTAYDSFRKQAKQAIKKAKREWKDAAGFLLADLDRDGFLDLAVADQAGTEGQPLMISLWDPEECVFVEAALFDGGDGEETRTLSLGTQGEPARLEIQWPQGDLQIFSMEEGILCEWSLETAGDAWSGASYLVDGEPVGKEEWESLRLSLLAEKAHMVPAEYLPLEDDVVQQATDVVLSEAEAWKWEACTPS